MARKATKGAAVPKKTAATGKATQSAVAEVMELISEKNFKTLVRKVMAAKKVIGEERGSLGGIIADACEHQHLHKGAFGIYCRIDAMSPRKRSALLFALDAMREMSDWDDELDLFALSTSAHASPTAGRAFVAKAAIEPPPEPPHDEVTEARQRREASANDLPFGGLLRT